MHADWMEGVGGAKKTLLPQWETVAANKCDGGKKKKMKERKKTPGIHREQIKFMFLITVFVTFLS